MRSPVLLLLLGLLLALTPGAEAGKLGKLLLWKHWGKSHGGHHGRSGGVAATKAQDHGSLVRNQADALARLQALVDSVASLPPPRRATKPTRASQRRRLDGKSLRSAVKAGRAGGAGRLPEG